MKTADSEIISLLNRIYDAQGGSGGGLSEAQVQALINTSTRNVQTYMDGLSGRPTYATWNSAQTTTDVLGVLNAAATDTPNGGTLVFPKGKYMTSNTWTIPSSIVIQGEGHSSTSITEISPLASFPAGADFITITGGHSAVRDIASNMQRRGGNWLTFIGEGGENFIERNSVSGVSAGHWGIELRDSGGPNGIALTQIDSNTFGDFDGGGIWGNGGGDSNNITRNVFQLIASTSNIIKWNGPSGAANLNIWANNASGASKFIELDTATQFKITNNQFEASTTITNAANAMIVVNGPANGGCIRDNNLNGASNVTNAIYLDYATDCYIDNNSISGVTKSVKTTAHSARITFFKGITSAVLDDATNAVSTIDGSGATILQGNLSFSGDSIPIGIQALHVNSGSGNVASGYQSLFSNTSGNYNVGSGSFSLYTNTTGTGNVGIGYIALSNVIGSYSTAIGYNSLGNNSTGSSNVALGYYAGAYELGSNSFYVDNQNRTNTAGDKAGAILYGTFNATPANQTLTVNGKFNVSTGKLNLAGIPTSASGLVTGDVWSNLGILTIVP